MRAKTNENYCHWGSITPDFSCLTVIKLIICICWTSFQCVRIKWFVFCRENGRFFATTAPDFTEISRVEALQLTRKLRALNSMCELNAIQCYKAVQFSIAIHLFRTWLTIETNRWNDRFNRIRFFWSPSQNILSCTFIPVGWNATFSIDNFFPPNKWIFLKLKLISTCRLIWQHSISAS